MTTVLGLTGGIASGKSTVSQLFIAAGVPVIDADLIARKVVEPGTKGLSQIVATFGEEMLHDGRLNRKKLGQLVFSNQEKLALLNQLLAQEIAVTIEQSISDWQKKEPELIVVDIPLLYESDYVSKMDKVMVVYVPRNVQLERLMKRDQLSNTEAEERLMSQWSLEKKKQLADIVIDNSGTFEATRQQVMLFLEKFRENKC